MTEEASLSESAAPQKKKFNRADYMFKERSGETLIKRPGEIDGKAFIIGNLTDCKVYLYDQSAQVSKELFAASYPVFANFFSR